jgi:hypothetical protein
MHKHDLNALIEFDDRRFHPKVLLSEPGYRMVLLSMRAGQIIPERTAQGILTIHAILGWITLFTESLTCELRAGQVVCIDTGVRIDSRLMRIPRSSFSLPEQLSSPQNAPKTWTCARSRGHNVIHSYSND